MASLALGAPLEDRVDFRMDGVSTLYTAAQLRGGRTGSRDPVLTSAFNTRVPWGMHE